MRDKSKTLILAITIISFLAIAGVFFWKSLKKDEEIFPSNEHVFNVSQGIEEGIAKEPAEIIKENNWEWLSKQEELYKLTPKEVDLILEELWKHFPDSNERLKAISLLRLGTPHKFDCLGEETGRDKDPIFRIDIADCTSFVLTNTALLHSENLEQARELMRLLNYLPGKEVSFENRLHFTTDRNIISPYFQDVTKKLAGYQKIKQKKVVLNKIQLDGKRLIDIDWEKEIVIEYIPNEYITKEFISSLPPALGIAFIKEKDADRGLDVAHEGFLFDGNTLIYASSIYKEVTMLDFMDYYFPASNKSKFDGITLFEIK